ncbi:MAG: AAA family ATPase [Proteobacteria bacterium]|nr:AAA family ATPase [Pseudomonadota bacterium]
MLHEQYRPTTWDEYVGNSKSVATVRRIISKPGYTGGAFWIDGPSGIGKTTLAWLAARDLVGSEIDIEEIDGDSCTVDRVRELSDSIRYRPIGGKFRAVIINEAHAMTARAVQAWLTLLERLPREVVIFFTTTEGRQTDLFGQFDGPLKSRCVCITLSSYGVAEEFALHAKTIAEREGLDGQPITKYKRLVADNKNNLRAVLSEIEAGVMVA